MRNAIIRSLAAAAIALGAVAQPASAAFYSLDHMSMKPSYVDFATTYAAKADGGLRNIRNMPACFSAGVHLPDGVTITKMTVTYSSGPNTTPSVALFRHRHVDNQSDLIVEESLFDDTNKRRTKTVSVNRSIATIDNKNYSYGLGICLGESEGDVFYAVRFTTTTKPQPPSED